MILYGSFTSPFVRHCRIELANAGIDYELVETDYAASDRGSPTKRVPYLEHEGTQLYDSSSILMFLKQQQGEEFLPTIEQMEHYQLAATALDTAINLFLLEREGQTPDNNAYLARQSARVHSSLEMLNEKSYAMSEPYNSAEISTACLLAWGLYRQRFEIAGLSNLETFLTQIDAWRPFAETSPPSE